MIMANSHTIQKRPKADVKKILKACVEDFGIDQFLFRRDQSSWEFIILLFELIKNDHLRPLWLTTRFTGLVSKYLFVVYIMVVRGWTRLKPFEYDLRSSEVDYTAIAQINNDITISTFEFHWVQPRK